ncbi:MAG: AAA family ATPase [Bradymonadia bacterium]
MAFKKMVQSKYPPRLWSLVGYPGSGKSTFAAQLQGPMVVVDADHRFQEVLGTTEGDVFSLSDTPSDNVNPDRISTLLNQNMPGAGVKTIVVDSLTAIITPIVVQAMLDHDKGRARNLSAAFKTKALAMRQLQDAVTRWGCDVLWIYHLQDARDAKANEITRATVSQTELARLTRSINCQLEIVENDQGQRGIKINWCRRGRSGMVIWDETGGFVGMPEKIEAAMYDGLSREEQESIERETPVHFPNPETAIAWGFEQGAFEALQHARNAYEKVKRERSPRNAREMASMWVEYVQEALVRKAAAEEGQVISEPEEEQHMNGHASADMGEALPF